MKRICKRNNKKSNFKYKTRDGIPRIIIDRSGVEKYYCSKCKKRYPLEKMRKRYGKQVPYNCKKCDREYAREKREQEKKKIKCKKIKFEKITSMTSGDAIRHPRRDDVYHPSRAQGSCLNWQKQRFVGGK